MKNYIELTGIPKIQFAHSFAEKGYVNLLPAEHKKFASLEIAYILDGNLQITLPGGKSYLAPSHSVVCNFHHDDLEVFTDIWHEHHTVCFAVPASFTDDTNPDGICIPLITELPPARGKILSLIDEIILSHTVHIKGDMTCTGLFLQLLDEIDRHNRKNAIVPANKIQKYVKKAKEFIFDHLNEPIYQTDIANHLGISSEYLCSVFKTSEGVPIMQFINKVKLEQIHNLMKNNGFTLAKASSLYGYNDPNYVSRLYKKYFHSNITDFKRNM